MERYTRSVSKMEFKIQILEKSEESSESKSDSLDGKYDGVPGISVNTLVKVKGKVRRMKVKLAQSNYDKK